MTTSAAVDCNRITRLREIALRALPRMYLPEQRRFVFRVRRSADGVVPQGVSLRYTAITLIGLAGEQEHVAADVLGAGSVGSVCQDLLAAAPTLTNAGDVALSIWAAHRAGQHDTDRALAHLRSLLHQPGLPTVEVAWALTALSLAPNHAAVESLRAEVAQRLRSAFVATTGLFRHHVDNPSGLRAHVGCFADLVYPIQAYAHYARVAPDSDALVLAGQCAQATCDRLGAAGQWWWHYDVRSGQVLEGYPVYSVHQDAMAPMALLDLADAGGTLHREAIDRGLAWLAASPELNGASLVDDKIGIIWRKVARREPRKLVRRSQALAARVHSALRVPGVNTLFPPGAIDDECRPYHLGWLLYAWPQQRATDWCAA